MGESKKSRRQLKREAEAALAAKPELRILEESKPRQTELELVTEMWEDNYKLYRRNLITEIFILKKIAETPENPLLQAHKAKIEADVLGSIHLLNFYADRIDQLKKAEANETTN